MYQSNMLKNLKSNRLCVKIVNNPSYVTDYITRERQLQSQLLVQSRNQNTVHSNSIKKRRHKYNNNDNVQNNNESSTLHTNVDNCNNWKALLLSYNNDIDFDVLVSHNSENYNNIDDNLYSSKIRNKKESENITNATNQSINIINTSSIYQHNYNNLLEDESELNTTAVMKVKTLLLF
jgi:hypothetical protein